MGFPPFWVAAQARCKPIVTQKRRSGPNKVRFLRPPLAALGDFTNSNNGYNGWSAFQRCLQVWLTSGQKKRHDPHGTSMIIQSGKLISRNLQVSNVEKLSLMLFRPTARSATGPRRKRSRGCPRTCRRVAMCTLNAWGPLPTQGRCQGQNCRIVGPFHVSIESTRNGKR